MKTKPIPAIVMLTAGFITCIVAIFQKMELLAFTKTLLLVLIIFYLLGALQLISWKRILKLQRMKKAVQKKKQMVMQKSLLMRKRRYIRKVRKRGREKSERRVIIRNRRLWHENSGQRKTVGKLSEKSSI